MLGHISEVRSPHQKKENSSYQYTSCSQTVFEVQPHSVLTHSVDFININIKNSMQDIIPI
jgi:hypothetical protein